MTWKMLRAGLIVLFGAVGFAAFCLIIIGLGLLAWSA